MGTCFIRVQIFSLLFSRDPLSQSSMTMLVFREDPSAAKGSHMLKRLWGSSVSTAYTATCSTREI